ncbi:phage tail protein I [Mastigocoleus testarum]|uniref:Phage tail protein n=1 Tax=Mastigocoleus testarum BC008 TaxID=371196 RepID=A0A0V7ZVJ1_9CYAN|nr:phage tail protein I [Mastigocoleus testarum]KST68627.1 phage tail protein [Mastigocoleus testarum BC008]
MNANTSEQQVSEYVKYLPSIYQDNQFLGRFLLAFEQILTGLPGSDTYGLEQYIDKIHTYFYPGYPSKENKINPEETAPKEFLPWLASWVALSLRDDWEEETKRRFISQIVPLYRLRGTKAGLTQILKLYTQEEVNIYEFDDPPHYFQVELSLSDRSDLARTEAIARAIIDQEKPAHTFYSLQLLFPSMQIINNYEFQPDKPEESKGLRLGYNSLLGTSSN